MTADDTVGLLDYAEVLLKHKRLITYVTAVFMVLSVVISLVLPKIYSATARFLPPQQDQSLLAAFLGQATGGLSSLASGLFGTGSMSDVCAGILDTEAIKDRIIDRFHLMEVYGNEYRLDTYKRLAQRVDISVGKKDGIVSITVDDKDPKRAAGMANAYVQELERLTLHLDTFGAGQKKVFIENRLSKARADLASAEDRLKDFQTKNKMIEVPDQAQVAIAGVADLKAQIAAKEVDLATLQRTFTDGSQEVKIAQTAILGLKGQLAKLVGNKPNGAIPSVGSVPALGQEYVRLMREFKTQEQLVELLTKQYELMRISAANDVSSIQVIQKAVPADKKTKPKRTLIVLGATFFGFCGSALAAFVLEHFHRLPEEQRNRWKALQKELPLIFRKRSSS